MSTWHAEFMRWKISTNTVYNTLKTDTKYSHSVRSRPTLKDKECFRNGLVRKPYERSLYERTLMTINETKMSEPSQTCQPLVKENLETHEKKSGDSTKNSEILFFP